MRTCSSAAVDALVLLCCFCCQNSSTIASPETVKDETVIRACSTSSRGERRPSAVLVQATTMRPSVAIVALAVAHLLQASCLDTPSPSALPSGTPTWETSFPTPTPSSATAFPTPTPIAYAASPTATPTTTATSHPSNNSGGDASNGSKW